MRRLFLSYSRDASDYAHRRAEALRRRAQIIDPADMSPGAQWGDRLRRQLQSADAMVLVVAGDAVDSKWVQFEVGAAVGLGKPVYTITLDKLDADRADYLLRDLHWIDAKQLTPEDVASRIYAAVVK